MTLLHFIQAHPFATLIWIWAAGAWAMGECERVNNMETQP